MPRRSDASVSLKSCARSTLRLVFTITSPSPGPPIATLVPIGGPGDGEVMVKTSRSVDRAQLLSETEASLLLGMTPEGVATLFRSGRLAALSIDGRRRYVIA